MEKGRLMAPEALKQILKHNARGEVMKAVSLFEGRREEFSPLKNGTAIVRSFQAVGLLREHTRKERSTVAAQGILAGIRPRDRAEEAYGVLRWIEKTAPRMEAGEAWTAFMEVCNTCGLEYASQVPIIYHDKFQKGGLPPNYAANLALSRSLLLLGEWEALGRVTRETKTQLAAEGGDPMHIPLLHLDIDSAGEWRAVDQVLQVIESSVSQHGHCTPYMVDLACRLAEGDPSDPTSPFLRGEDARPTSLSDKLISRFAVAMQKSCIGPSDVHPSSWKLIVEAQKAVCKKRVSHPKDSYRLPFTKGLPRAVTVFDGQGGFDLGIERGFTPEKLPFFLDWSFREEEPHHLMGAMPNATSLRTTAEDGVQEGDEWSSIDLPPWTFAQTAHEGVALETLAKSRAGSRKWTIEAPKSGVTTRTDAKWY